MLGQAAAEVRVPGVTVHDVDVREGARHLEIQKQRRKQLCMAWVLGRHLDGRTDATNLQIPEVFSLISETQHSYRVAPVVERGQLARQVLHMDPGPAID